MGGNADPARSRMTQLPRSTPEAKIQDIPKPTTRSWLLGQPAWLKIGAGVGLCLLVLVPVLYFALRGKPTVLVIYGDVDIRDVNLGFRVPGRIETVLKDEGDSVSQGELVASLDKSTYQEALATHTADVEMKVAVLKDAEVTLKRDEAMVATGGISKLTYDNDLSARDQALPSLHLAQAQLASAQTDLDDAEIHSPSDGVVMTRAEEPGAIVPSGNTVLTISLYNPVWVRAYISESNLGDVHPGEEVEVFTDTQPNHPYHGKVGFVSPEAEFTPKSVEATDLRTSLVYRLRIVIDDSGPHLRQGMPCTVKIHLR
jgi:HlyD family secretion protein